MRKIPEKYELNQDDLEEAITDWLNRNHTDDDGNSFIIEFKVERKMVPFKPNMIDPYPGPDQEVQIVSAIAEKE